MSIPAFDARFDQKRGNQPIPTTRRVAYPRTHNTPPPPHPTALATRARATKTDALALSPVRAVRVSDRNGAGHTHTRPLAPYRTTLHTLSLSHTHGRAARYAGKYASCKTKRRECESEGACVRVVKKQRASDIDYLAERESRSRAAAAWGGSMLWQPDGAFRLT